MIKYWFVFFTGLLSFPLMGQQKSIAPKVAIEYKVNDTLDLMVELTQDSASRAYFYHTFLSTDICNDKVCLPIQVDLYWNLMGEYDHFSVPVGHAFTKFDHQHFDKSDYNLLHKILLDTISPMRDYAVEDFLDKRGQKYSVQLDAVTRPTLKIFSNVAVPGALYTVYALWHVVNGPIKSMIRQRLDKLYKQARLETYFATSMQADYQRYFLENLSSEQIQENEKLLVDLLYSKDEYVPHYAWNKLGHNFYGDPDKYNRILTQLEALKPHMQLAILKNLKNPNKETKEILRIKTLDTDLSQKLKELMYKLMNYEK